jgi:hypothetical protein
MYTRREVTKSVRQIDPDLRKVKPLTQEGQIETGQEYLEQERKLFEDFVDKAIVRFVRALRRRDQFGVNDKTAKRWFAKANDLMLRHVFLMPIEISQNAQNMNYFWERVKDRADKVVSGECVLKRKSDAHAMCNRVTAEIDRLKGSVEQLFWYSLSVWNNNPDTIIATGVDLDVDFDIDLLELNDVVFDELTSSVTAKVRVIQAKSASNGLTREDFEDIVRAYNRMKSRIKDDLIEDVGWFREHISEPFKLDELSEDEIEELLEGGIDELRIIEELRDFSVTEMQHFYLRCEFIQFTGEKMQEKYGKKTEYEVVVDVKMDLEDVYLLLEFPSGHQLLTIDQARKILQQLPIAA